MRDAVDLLADARDHARKAASYVAGIGAPTFAADAMRREAVCFCLLVIGEACRQISAAQENLSTEIPWAEINGMRNILVHEYWQIDEAIIYNVARNEAGPLARRFDRLSKDPSRK
jgi:uncharacterized protein with HEPN domain